MVSDERLCDKVIAHKGVVTGDDFYICPTGIMFKCDDPYRAEDCCHYGSANVLGYEVAHPIELFRAWNKPEEKCPGDD